MVGTSPIDRASHIKRSKFHLVFTWEKPAVLPRLARLAQSLGLTSYIHFPTKPDIRYLRTSLHFITYT